MHCYAGTLALSYFSISTPKTFYPEKLFQHFLLYPEHSINTECIITSKFLQTVLYTKVLLNCESHCPVAKKKKMVKANTTIELLHISIFNSLPVTSQMLRLGDSQEIIISSTF